MKTKMRLLFTVLPMTFVLACGNATTSEKPSATTDKATKLEAGVNENNSSKMESIGSLGLTIETPFKFKPTDVDVDPATAKLIEKQENYSFETKDDEAVLLSVVRYKKEVEVDLKGAKKGALDAMVAYLKGNVVDEKEEMQERDGMKIIKYKSEIEKTAMGEIVLHSAFFQKEHRLLQVIAMYKKEDANKLSGKVDKMIATAILD